MGAAILKSSLRLQEPRFLAVTPQGDPDRTGGFRQRLMDTYLNIFFVTFIKMYL